MIFPNDIVIGGKCARIFRDMKEKFGFDFIDSFFYSSVLGVMSDNQQTESITESEKDDDHEINIPRNVLMSRQDKIEFISTMIVLLEKSKNDFEELLQIAFEENSVENPKIYRLLRMEYYAILGSSLMENELVNHSNLEILDRVSDILNDIQQ